MLRVLHQVLGATETVAKKSLKRGMIGLVLLFVAIGSVAMGGGYASAVAGPPPINVHAFVGGNSIALLWNPAVGDTPTSYKVYRNGVLKATVSPSSNNMNGTGQRWYDTTVVNGTAYTYQVSGVNAASEESVKTVAINVTQPASPVAVPTITIDPSVPATLTTFMNTEKALMQVWYPKFVTMLGNSAGTPTAFTLTSSSTQSAPAQTAGNIISYSESWALANAGTGSADSVSLHEVTHVAQGGQSRNYTSWAVEGMANVASTFWFNNQVPPPPTATESWMSGYNPTAYFLNWISVTYNKPNFVKDFHQSFNLNYSPSFFKTQTGLTVGELWQKMTGKKISSPMYFKNNGASLQCLDLNGNSAANGTDFKLAACNAGFYQQLFMFTPNNITDQWGEIRVSGSRCLDVSGSGTADGTKVWSWDCNSGVAQQWFISPIGQLINKNANKCLQPVAGGTAAGTNMEIKTCDGTSIQNWFVRPLGQMKSWNGYGFANGGTTSGATTAGAGVYMYGASATSAPVSQQWEYIQSSAGATNGSIKLNNQALCMNPVGNGTAVNTLIEVQTCDGRVSENWQWQADNTVKNINSGFCLNIPSWVGGTQLKLVSCASPTNLSKWDVLYQY